MSQIDLVLPAFVPLWGCRSVPFAELFLRHHGTGARLLLRVNGLNAVSGKDATCVGWGMATPRTLPFGNILSWCEVSITRTLKDNCGLTSAMPFAKLSP
jgi:hypothetical protein